MKILQKNRKHLWPWESLKVTWGIVFYPKVKKESLESNMQLDSWVLFKQTNFPDSAPNSVAGDGEQPDRFVSCSIPLSPIMKYVALYKHNMHAKTCWHSHLSLYTLTQYTHVPSDAYTHIHTHTQLPASFTVFFLNLQPTAVWHGHMLWRKAHFYLHYINMNIYMKNIIWSLENKHLFKLSAVSLFCLL